MVEAPKGAKSDMWQTVEFSKRFTTDETWPKEILDKNPMFSIIVLMSLYIHYNFIIIYSR